MPHQLLQQHYHGEGDSIERRTLAEAFRIANVLIQYDLDLEFVQVTDARGQIVLSAYQRPPWRETLH